jgi:hypothetical protein
VIQRNAPRLRPGGDLGTTADYVDRVLVLLTLDGVGERELAEIDAERLLARLHRNEVPELHAAFRLLVLLGRIAP